MLQLKFLGPDHDFSTLITLKTPNSLIAKRNGLRDVGLACCSMQQQKFLGPDNDLFTLDTPKNTNFSIVGELITKKKRLALSRTCMLQHQSFFLFLWAKLALSHFEKANYKSLVSLEHI